MSDCPAGFIRVVVDVDKLSKENARVNVDVSGRYLTLIRYKGKLFAIDATCYHMGGPLKNGDIEDLGTSYGPCIICPWHSYKISLKTGDCIYEDTKHNICTKGVKQRTHKIIEDSKGAVFVKISSIPENVTSDRYAFKKPAPSNVRLQRRVRNSSSVRSIQRSGDVLRLQREKSNSVSKESRYGAAIRSSMRGGDGVAPWSLSKK